MPEVSRYAAERLAALYDRVESLEHAVEAAGAFLEAGLTRGTAEIDAKSALKVLQAGIMQDFRSAVACNREMTDEQLDEWLKEAPPNGQQR
jgi:hypothetical protein